jgi:SAM-dependent methyltransferase
MAFLQELRESELRDILPFLPPRGRLLDIGAGAGWQAKYLSELGYEVEAADVAASGYAAHRVFPIREYDGRTLPYPQAHFDVVFCSHLLLQIRHLSSFHEQMRRVMKSEGLTVIVIGSSTWRIWTNVAFYLVLPCRVARWVARRCRGLGPKPEVDKSASNASGPSLPNPAESILKLIAPPRQGTVGNALSEIWLFSRQHWVKVFRDDGWRVEHQGTIRLFFTGEALLGVRLNIPMRRALGHVLGGSANFYILRKLS